MPASHNLRIAYFGTPEFAATILNDLVTKHYNIVGVVTAPDRPSGRGQKLQATAVKTVAEAHNLPLLQPEKLKDETFLTELAAWEADLFIVVAFRMLPKEVWAMPRLGTFNLHAALLPDFRGAAPIQHAIMCGCTETGATTFLLDEHIDTGKILLQEKVEITNTETGGSLHDKLMHLGCKLVPQTIDYLWTNGPEVAIDQNAKANSLMRPAPKIFKQDREILFTQNTATQIERKVRALSPSPCAFATWHIAGEAHEVKIHSAVQLPTTNLKAGEVYIHPDNRILVGTTNGDIELLELQMPSKRRMSAQDLLRGLRLPNPGTFQ